MRGFYFLISILVFAPLVFGGNRPIPLLILELLALVLAGYLIQKQDDFSKYSKLHLGFLVILFLIPLLQLIPLPFQLWLHLPGHSQYAQGLLITGNHLADGARAASLVPSLTEFSLLALLPPVMVFLFTLSLPREQIKTAVIVLLAIASFQAILGLMQYGAGAESFLRLNNNIAGKAATGTYANRDHLAGFLEMVLPLALAMLTASIGNSHATRRHTRNLRQRLAAMTATHLNQAVVYAVIAIAILLGLIFTQSRTGVVLSMLVILLSTLSFATRIGGKNVYGIIGTFAAIGLMLAVEIGLAPVLNRFVVQDPLQDARWLIFSDVANAIGEFFPLGSGAGTFNQVYPHFQGYAFADKFVNRAHNDYLEWIMEGGLLAAVLILVFFVLYFKRWIKVWKRGDWKTLNFIQVGAGIGLFVMMLHTFVDFNLHIPANQIYFAFLAALFFYQTGHTDSHSVADEPVHADSLPSAPQVVRPEKKSFVVQSSNPFSQ